MAGQQRNALAANWHLVLLVVLLSWDLTRFTAQKWANPSATTRQPLLDRPLVIYVYHETEDAYKNAKYFAKAGLHAGADFFFVSNGPGRLESILPLHLPNVQFLEKNNSCFDLGTYGIILNEDIGDGVRRRDRYKHFILMNASIRGPLMPYWAMHDTCWTERWVNPIDEQVKMVGLLFNCNPGGRADLPYIPPHIQSMIFGFDNVSLDLLMQGGDGSLNKCYIDYLDAVYWGETLVTQLVEKAGYKDLTMVLGTHEPNWRDHCWTGNMNGHNGYFGFQVHPYEGFFCKTKHRGETEGFPAEETDAISDWSDVAGFASSNVCDKLYKPLVQRHVW